MNSGAHPVETRTGSSGVESKVEVMVTFMYWTGSYTQTGKTRGGQNQPGLAPRGKTAGLTFASADNKIPGSLRRARQSPTPGPGRTCASADCAGTWDKAHAVRASAAASGNLGTAMTGDSGSRGYSKFRSREAAGGPSVGSLQSHLVRRIPSQGQRNSCVFTRRESRSPAPGLRDRCSLRLAGEVASRVETRVRVR